MGLTTPFPEPESDALRRFAVRSRAEIIGLLRALQHGGVPLNAFHDVDSACELATVLNVDESADSLAVEVLGSACLLRAIDPVVSVTFVGFLEGAKLQFTATGAGTAAFAGQPAWSAPIPTQIIRVERRAATRIYPDASRSAWCRLPVANRGEFEALRVLDIGLGGLAVLAYPERRELAIGARIDGCRLDLPGVGGAEVSLRVRHMGLLSGDGAVRFCGCEFVEPSTAFQRMLASYVEQCRQRPRAFGGVGQFPVQTGLG